MKLIKRLILLVILLVVLAVGGVIAGVVYIDSIAKAAVEKGGTYALGVTTTLNKADVGILGGTFQLLGLKVANPPGYKSDSFIKLGDGSVAVAFSTLRKDIVDLPSLKLTDIDVNLEKNGDTSNYKVILDNLKKLESGETKSKEGGKRYVIDKVEIRNIKVHANLVSPSSPISDLTKVNVTLDEVVLQNVGTAGKGVPLPDLAGIIVQALMSAIAEKGGGGLIPNILLDDLKSQLANLKGLADLGVNLSVGTIGEAGKVVEGVLKEADKTGKKLEEGLKGIIPGGDKKK
jgi:hypothetical protein